MSEINEYFDHVYLLNLRKRHERLKLSRKRLAFAEIEHEVFNGIDGSILKHFQSKIGRNLPNQNYLGCFLSHLSIYADALDRGFGRILILEDDVRIHRNADCLWTNIPQWDDLLYPGYIPLSDDQSHWDYSVFGPVKDGTFVAKNLWGLFSYGITASLMRETIGVYNASFPMEIDRYYVSIIQPRGRSVGMSPQIFCHDDGLSDNSGKVETDMLSRSIDSRSAKHSDYV